MSEFQSDIKDKKYDEEGNELDKHGFRIKRYPDGFESVRIAIENAEFLCGLDRNLMGKIIKGDYAEYSTSDHSGRQSKKIVIEYNIKQKENDT